MTNRIRPISIAWLLACVASLIAAPVAAQIMAPIPETENVEIEDKRGAEIPGDVIIKDADGNAVPLRDLFDGERPVVLVLAYYHCPLLCTLVHNNLQQAINDMSLTIGEDYRVVTVSFDFRDTQKDAQEHRLLYHAGLKDDPGKDGWLFCTSTDANARKIADAVGFRYRFLPDSGEFSHPSAIFILSPEGTVHNFIEHVKYQPRDLKLAIVEAAEGRVGTIFDRVFLTCFSYDGSTGKYTVTWMNITRIVAALTVVALGSTIGGLLWTGSKRRRSALDAVSSSIDPVDDSDTVRNE